MCSWHEEDRKRTADLRRISFVTSIYLSTTTTPSYLVHMCSDNSPWCRYTYSEVSVHRFLSWPPRIRKGQQNQNTWLCKDNLSTHINFNIQFENKRAIYAFVGLHFSLTLHCKAGCVKFWGPSKVQYMCHCRLHSNDIEFQTAVSPRISLSISPVFGIGIFFCCFSLKLHC